MANLSRNHIENKFSILEIYLQCDFIIDTMSHLTYSNAGADARIGGFGMVLVCSPEDVSSIRLDLEASGETVHLLGHLTL